jgi:hypothetical protein
MHGDGCMKPITSRWESIGVLMAVLKTLGVTTTRNLSIGHMDRFYHLLVRSGL